MAKTATCPECNKKGRPGENIYTRDDGTFKCRTCGYDSKKLSKTNKTTKED